TKTKTQTQPHRFPRRNAVSSQAVSMYQEKMLVLRSGEPHHGSLTSRASRRNTLARGYLGRVRVGIPLRLEQVSLIFVNRLDTESGKEVIGKGKCGIPR